MEALIGRQVRHLDPQQVFDSASDVVAFAHLGGGAHQALEILLRGFGVARQAHSDIGHEPDSAFHRVRDRAVAGNHPASFQILHPPQTGRRGQAHAVCKFQVADPPVPRQDTQYMFGYLINIGHGLQK